MASALHEMGIGRLDGGRHESALAGNRVSARADKVSTAILQTTTDTDYLGYMATYRALRDLEKPIELYIYPNELHVINQPKHRLEIYERNVDWFLFWLKDEEDPNPAKTDEFARWRMLRSANPTITKANR